MTGNQVVRKESLTDLEQITTPFPKECSIVTKMSSKVAINGCRGGELSNTCARSCSSAKVATAVSNTCKLSIGRRSHCSAKLTTVNFSALFP
eukprot:Gb_33964 [translate_table: standard]